MITTSICKGRSIVTIVEAIKSVLNDHTTGMTASEIQDEIVLRNLYVFKAKNPVSVVNVEIRRRCYGLDFPTSYPVKIFKKSGYKGKKPLYVISEEDDNVLETTNKGTDVADLLPEEKMSIAYSQHLESVRAHVLESVLNNSPSFFEHLVVDLLLRMGYGNDKNSGIVTGRSHDGGIDGIINEDKLGLDKIYIQAKRYSENNTVGRKEIQAFVGAMESINKGVFITTSRFTKEAASFIERQQKNIKLIDGKLLSDLLVKYQVGIISVQSMSILRVDSDYYNE